MDRLKITHHLYHFESLCLFTSSRLRSTYLSFCYLPFYTWISILAPVCLGRIDKSESASIPIKWDRLKTMYIFKARCKLLNGIFPCICHIPMTAPAIKPKLLPEVALDTASVASLVGRSIRNSRSLKVGPDNSVNKPCGQNMTLYMKNKLRGQNTAFVKKHGGQNTTLQRSLLKTMIDLHTERK